MSARFRMVLVGFSISLVLVIQQTLHAKVGGHFKPFAQTNSLF